MIKARIGIINKTINMLDFLLAEDAGLYRKHGLEVEFDTLGRPSQYQGPRGRRA